MGIPGSETALDELMCRDLRDCLKYGIPAKLADDLYCGADSVEALLENWRPILHALHKCNPRPSPSKTAICPKSTTVLGWIWTQRTLSDSPPSHCDPRVLPKCAHIIAPLEDAICGLQSTDKVIWFDTIREQFNYAQTRLTAREFITLPRPTDQLWIVTDGSVTRRGIGATLYDYRDSKIQNFASRNAPECNQPRCQICSFIILAEDSVDRSTITKDIRDRPNLPSTTRSAWLQIKSECPDIRCTHAHLK